MPLTNSVILSLFKNPSSGRLEVIFDPPVDQGNVQQPDNFKKLNFTSKNPFAIYVARRLSGPFPDVISPFGKERILLSKAKNGAFEISENVNIPWAKFGDYEFCYLAILFTDDQQEPVVVSADPKIIIGKQNPLGIGARPEIVTALQCFQRFFPQVGRKKRVSKSKATAKKSAARKSPAGKPKSRPKK